MIFSGLLLKNHHSDSNVTNNKGHIILRERMPGSNCEDPAVKPQGRGTVGTAGSNFLIKPRVSSLGEVQFSGTVREGWREKKRNSQKPFSI